MSPAIMPDDDGPVEATPKKGRRPSLGSFKLPKRKSADDEAGDKAKKPRSRGMAFRASKGAKFVLFVGDEGAILTFILGRTVQSRQFVPDAGPPSLKELKQTLLRHPDAPLFLVVDNMDQTYMQQTLPPVSALSINKLVKRRLERDFADTEIKGAMLIGREKKGRKDWNYMMVAVEKSPQLAVWLDFIDEMPNYFRGIYLVATESEYLVKYIEHFMEPRPDEMPAEWKFLVSHNKVGGFRQVILRNGKVIFTRLAQPIGESSTEMVAGNIEQEMQSTIEYMKRLSYTPQHGLDIYIIASSGIRDAIDSNKFPNASMYVYTPYELAQKLGIEGATQPTDQFGDVILATAIGCSRKHVLSLSTPASKRVNQYFQILYAQRVAAAMGALGLLGYIAAMGVGMISLSSEAGEMEEQMQQQRAQIASLRNEINQSDLDIERVNDLLEVYIRLLKEEVSVLPFIKAMLPMKQAPVWIKEIRWNLGAKPDAQGLETFPTGEPSEQMVGVVRLEFLNVTADPKGFKLVSTKILEDASRWFPGYQVEYTYIPDAYKENNSLEITISDEEDGTEQINSIPPEVELSITGKLIKGPLPEQVDAGASAPQASAPSPEAVALPGDAP